MVEHLEVVVQEAVLARAQVGNGRPFGRGGIVVRLQGRELTLAQIEEMAVRDGASARAPVGLIEHVRGLQTGAQGIG